MDAVVKKENKVPDIILLLVTLILVTVGTAMIYSSSSIIALEKFKDGQYFLKKVPILFYGGQSSGGHPCPVQSSLLLPSHADLA